MAVVITISFHDVWHHDEARNRIGSDLLRVTVMAGRDGVDDYGRSIIPETTDGQESRGADGVLAV